jgi:hypothetical protein
MPTDKSDYTTEKETKQLPWEIEKERPRTTVLAHLRDAYSYLYLQGFMTTQEYQEMGYRVNNWNSRQIAKATSATDTPATFRLVYMLPDVTSESFVTIAAIVSQGEQETLVRATRLPTVSELGSIHSLVGVVLDFLSQQQNLKDPTLPLGTQSKIGGQHSLPKDVSRPVEWVVQNILPR